MKDKIFISNMCQAGWINSVIQNCPYKHPFIFSIFLEKDFVTFVKDFNQMDLTKFKKINYLESKFFEVRNLFIWDRVNDARGISTEECSVIEYQNGVQVIHPHVIKTDFDELYNKRLSRFLDNNDKEIYFIFRVRKYVEKQLVQIFYNLNDIKKVILFDEDVNYVDDFVENRDTTIIVTSKEHQQLMDQLSKMKLFQKN